MLKCFVLEDEIDFAPRNAIKDALKEHDVTYARSLVEAKEKYEGPYDLLLLDHDMRGLINDHDYPNGYDFVKWLIKEKVDGADLPHVVIHSHSYVGARNMELLLKDYGFSVEKYPFNSQYVRELKKVLKDRDSI